jgi:arsenite methyltransferase
VKGLERTPIIDLKARCATFYESEPVRLLLGDRVHPGGERLTRRLADLVGISSGDRVLDVASGRGTTARLLAAERGATVLGVELSPRLTTGAEQAASQDGLGHLVTFRTGDAERLPVDGPRFDVVLCECALCTFPDQAAAVGGFRRSLRPGGRIGLADVTLDRDRVPRELDTPIGRVACVAGARPASGYEHLLLANGFVDVVIEPHPEAALAVVDSIRDGLESMRGSLRAFFDVPAALRVADIAAAAVHDGTIGYALITATLADGAETRASAPAAP